MEINITGRHFQVTEAMKDHIIDKMQRLDKFSSKLESARVVLEVQKFIHIAEITARGKNLRLVAKHRDSDMYAAFDGCFGNIQLQLRRIHEKDKDHKGKRYAAKPAKS